MNDASRAAPDCSRCCAQRGRATSLWTLPVLLLTALWGCEGGRLAKLLTSAERHVTVVESGPEPVGGRILPGGAGIALHYRDPGSLRLFGRDGSLANRSTHIGGEPVQGLATLGDSLLVLAHRSGRLTAVTPRGERVAQRAVEGVVVLSIVEGCAPGELILYGPAALSDGTTGWLHSVRWSAEELVQPRPLYSDSSALQVAPTGHSYGLVRTRDGVEVQHAAETPTRVLRYSCTMERVASIVVPRSGTFRDRFGPTSRHTPEYKRRNGILVAGGLGRAGHVTLLVDQVLIPGRHTGTESLLHLISRDRIRSRMVDGTYRILDSRPGVGVLFFGTVPHAQVFLVPESKLRTLVR